MMNELNKVHFRHYSDGSGDLVGITGKRYFSYDKASREITQSDVDNKWTHYEFPENWKQEIFDRYIENLLPKELEEAGLSMEEVSEYVSDYEEERVKDIFEEMEEEMSR